MLFSISHHVMNCKDNVVTARQRARQVAEALSTDEPDRTLISTGVPELASVFRPCSHMRQIEFLFEGESVLHVLLVRIGDASRSYLMECSCGFETDLSRKAGLPPSSGLADSWISARSKSRQESDETVTATQLGPPLPKRTRVLAAQPLERIVQQLLHKQPTTLIEEVPRQNHELLCARSYGRRYYGRSKKGRLHGTQCRVREADQELGEQGSVTPAAPSPRTDTP